MRSSVFRGIEGANPLGFLAALGAFRLFGLMWREENIQLRWVREGGWRPEVSGLPTDDEEKLCALLRAQGPWAALDAFSELGNNLTVARSLFERVVGMVTNGATAGDRRAVDFVAAFGSDVFEDKEKDRIEYTDLCFITGSGHQHFLGTVKSLAGAVGPEHLREALFGPWRYADKGLSMRWDPDDAREYALRWRDPSVGGVSSVWGASLLAFEALPLFPTVPTVKGLRTTGFRTQKRAHEFTWPIWTQPASVDTVRSLLSLSELEKEAPDRAKLQPMGVDDGETIKIPAKKVLDRAKLQPMGVDEVFRVQRVRIGQGANFKVSFRPARSV